MFFRALQQNVRQLDVEPIYPLSIIFRRAVLGICAIRYFAAENYPLVATCLMLDMTLTMLEIYFPQDPEPAFEFEPEPELEPQPNFVGIKFTLLEYTESVIRAIDEYILQLNKKILENKLQVTFNIKCMRITILAMAANTHTFASKLPIETIPMSKLILLDGYAFNTDELKNYFASSVFGIRNNPYTNQQFSLYAINEFREIETPRITAVTPRTMFKPVLRDRIQKQLTIQTSPLIKRNEIMR